MLVLMDFQGQLEDELNMKAGDVIRNAKKTVEDGWLEGELNGKKGVFPQIFAKEIPSVFLNDNGQRYPRSIRKVNACIQKTKQRLCRAEYDYTPGKPDELELCAGEVFEVLEEIEDGWWLGKKGNIIGAFPSNYVQEIAAPPSEKLLELKKNNKQRPKMMESTFIPNDEEKGKQEDKSAMKNQKAADSVSSLQTVQEFCRVMFDYTPSLQDELALKKGDVVSIISKESEDEGWWRGELNGKTGLFPDNFVILLPPTSQIKTNKPPMRTLTVRGQAKVISLPVDQTLPAVNGPGSSSSTDQTDISTMDKKYVGVTRPESPASTGQKAKTEKTTVDKKLPDVNRPVSPTSAGQKAKTDAAKADKKLPDVKRPESPATSTQKVNTSTTTDKKDVNKADSSSSQTQKDQKEAKAESASKPSHHPAKKPAPAPPVPAKSKHSAANKPASDSQSKLAEDGKEKSTNTLEGLRVSSVKLAHPTAERPKIQGRRPPKTNGLKNLTEPVCIKEEEQVNSHIKSPTSAKAMPKFSTSSGQASTQTTKTSSQSPSLHSNKQSVDSVQSAQVEELAAEIKSLKLMMEILKNKHLKDMEDIRGEISEERIKRLALQMEIENLKVSST
ncbi:SH3 domain-containing protein 21 isoform X1 [Pelobates fuscus]